MTTANTTKPKVLLIVKKDLYSLIFSHIEEQFEEKFDLIKIYSDQLDQDNLSKDLPDLSGVKAYVTSWRSPAVNQEFLNLMPDLEIVAHAAGSIKNYVCEQAFENDIKVTSAHMALAPSVAETTLMLTLMGLKLYKKQSKRIEAGKYRTPEPVGYELLEKTVGLIGYGRIARCFRQLLTGFNTEVLAYDPYLEQKQIASEDVKLVELDELLSSSHVVSLHAPGIKENDKIIDAGVLVKMQDDTLIVNTARGILIDEDALYDELKTGRLRAALDVTRNEPLPLDSPLRELDNFIVTPHIGGYTFDSRRHAGELILEELCRHFQGEELQHEAQIKQLDHRA
ncbi:MAG: hydroxyacid dehydrogenase [bacterium]